MTREIVNASIKLFYFSGLLSVVLCSPNRTSEFQKDVNAIMCFNIDWTYFFKKDPLTQNPCGVLPSGTEASRNGILHGIWHAHLIFKRHTQQRRCSRQCVALRTRFIPSNYSQEYCIQTSNNDLKTLQWLWLAWLRILLLVRLFSTLCYPTLLSSTSSKFSLGLFWFGMRYRP